MRGGRAVGLVEEVLALIVAEASADPSAQARLGEVRARLAAARNATAVYMEAVARGPLDDPGHLHAAIRLAFTLGLDEAPEIANTLEILINPPEPDWTGDEDA